MIVNSKWVEENLWQKTDRLNENDRGAYLLRKLFRNGALRMVPVRRPGYGNETLIEDGCVDMIQAELDNARRLGHDPMSSNDTKQLERTADYIASKSQGYRDDRYYDYKIYSRISYTALKHEYGSSRMDSSTNKDFVDFIGRAIATDHISKRFDIGYDLEKFVFTMACIEKAIGSRRAMLKGVNLYHAETEDGEISNNTMTVEFPERGVSVQINCAFSEISETYTLDFVRSMIPYIEKYYDQTENQARVEIF